MIHLRPHHILCISLYRGSGYSGKFCKNMENVIKRLQNGEEFSFIQSKDDICLYCPKLEDECKKALLYDKKISSIISLDKKETYQKLIEETKEKIIDKDLLKEICSDCQWLMLCEKISKTMV